MGISISTSTWQTIIADAITVAQDLDLALTAGAALGVPEAGIVEPFVAILRGVLVKAEAASQGNLSALTAAVTAADTAADVALATKFDPATGQPR